MRIVARPWTPKEGPIEVVVTSTARNVGDAAGRCIESVRRQRQRAPHFYVDACSNDNTLTIAESASQGDPLVKIVECAAPYPLLANLLPIWRALPDETVIVWLDGDDYLAHDQALETVANAHRDGAWMTYGSFIYENGAPGFAAPVMSAPRQAPWTSTHLKSFRAGLVKRIRDDDLRQPNGEYIDLAIDQALVIPMLEMAGSKRSRFIRNVLCVYRLASSFQAHASDQEQAREWAEVTRIRSLPPYAPLP